MYICCLISEPDPKMLNSKELKELKSFLSMPKRIVLTTHTNPDGDAIGSSMALYYYFLKKGHIVSTIVPNDFPAFLSWIPGSEKMYVFEKNAKAVQQLFEEAEIIFCLDFNALSRVGSMTETLKKSEAPKVLIDHHIDPELESFTFIHSTVHISSTTELIYDFISKMNDLDLIDNVIADCIYTGIVTDTGSFSFAANRSKTYRITADLIDRGLVPDKIHRLIYDTFSENRLRLLGHGINSRMIVWKQMHAALIYFTLDDLENYNYQVGDTEGVVNYPLSMENINVSVLLTEREKNIRISFRSKGNFDVNELARKHFNGGGHKNAAGGKSFVSINETIESIKNVLDKYKKQLDYQLTY
jgi:phosphoesterase RecJ-like protein